MVHAFLHRQVLARYPKLSNLVKLNLANTMSIHVSQMCCLEENFELL